MARYFDETEAYALEGGFTAISGYPFTMSCWVKHDTPADGVCFGFGDNGEASGVIIEWYSNDWYVSNRKDGGGFAEIVFAASSSGVWEHIVVTVASATALEAFSDGSSVGTSSTSVTGVTWDSFWIGSWNGFFGGLPFKGTVADASIWNVTLTSGEIAALAAGVRPTMIRPDALKLLMLWSDRETDLVAGYAPTATGTPALADMPPVSPQLFVPQMWLPQPSGAPASQAIGLNLGAVSNAGASHAVAPGSVAVGMAAGAVSIAGNAHTVAPGPVTIELVAAATASSAGLLTVQAGPVLVALTAGAASSSGNAHTITNAGVLSAGLELGTVSPSGKDHTITPGPVTIGMALGAVSPSGNAHTVGAGAVIVALEAGGVASTGAQHTIPIPNPPAIGMNAGAVASSGNAHALAVGAVTVSLAAGALSLSGPNITISGGIPPNPPPDITYGFFVGWEQYAADVLRFDIAGSLGNIEDGGVLGNARLGSYGTADEFSDRLKSFTVNRGRSSAQSQDFSGRGEFVLHDPDGYFNPANTASPLGTIVPGRMCKLTLTYDGTTETVFEGQVQRIRHTVAQRGNGSYTVLTAEDLRTYLSRVKLVTESGVTGQPGSIIAEILNGANVPWTASYLGSAADSYTLEGVALGAFDTPSALGAIDALLEAERGQFFYDRKGTPRFDPRGYRAGYSDYAVPSDDGRDLGTIDALSVSIQPVASSDTVVNRVVVVPAGSDIDGERAAILEDAASQELYGIRETRIDSDYLTAFGDAEHVGTFMLESFSDPALEAQSIEIRQSSAEALGLILTADVNCLLHVTDTIASVDADYWIEGVSHSCSERGAHSCRLTLSKVITGLPEFSVG